MAQFEMIILCGFSCTLCNFKCDYCYISRTPGRRQNKLCSFNYSVDHMAKAFSIKRLGGKCLFIVTADGETLLQPEIIDLTIKLLEEGHFVEITTNCSISKAIDRLLSIDKELQNRLIFKCSLHYLELKKRKLLTVFANNVNAIRKSNCSFTIELLASDIYIPFIDEIKEYCINNFGALPHLSIDRDDRTDLIEYSTKDLKLFFNSFSQFNSKLFSFKKSIFLKPIKDYCYSGRKVLYVSLSSGLARQCYCSIYQFNIFENSDKRLSLHAIGRHCHLAHCYNGHSVFSFGTIPNKYKEITYYDERNRTTKQGDNWIKDYVRPFYSAKLIIKRSLLQKIKDELSMFLFDKHSYLISIKKRHNIHKKLKQYHKQRIQSNDIYNSTSI